MRDMKKNLLCKPKLFIVRKYIKALSAKEAIKKDKATPVDEVWVDDEWKKNQQYGLADAIGFVHEKEDA